MPAATPGPTAHSVLAATVRALPAGERAPLLPGPGTMPVPFSAVTDEAWLTEQIVRHARRWGTDDRRVLATLWWYSASVWFQGPAIASLVATGYPLSPALPDVTAHCLPDGLVTGATSSRVLAPGVEQLGLALREVLGVVIPLVAAVGRTRERPLWAVASDSTANGFLSVGRALGGVARASELAMRVAEVVGPPLPRPRWVDVVPEDRDGADRPGLGPHRFTRRSSCCLIDQAPLQTRCDSCPRRAPEDRLLRMRRAVPVRSLAPQVEH